MAYVVLPSETARLVYGYLVNENMNDVAVQFLNSSPYLMDCCQIVKRGYQFNTKLMGKDLPELLQEYSNIHNLVNNKISSLCRTSVLYKRIKLRCENLSEILELLLSWQSKSSKSKSVNSSSPNKKDSSNLDASSKCDNSAVSEISQMQVSENVIENINVNDSNAEQQSNLVPEVNNSKIDMDISTVDDSETNDNENSRNKELQQSNDTNQKESSLHLSTHNNESQPLENSEMSITGNSEVPLIENNVQPVKNIEVPSVENNEMSISSSNELAISSNIEMPVSNTNEPTPLHDDVISLPHCTETPSFDTELPSLHNAEIISTHNDKMTSCNNESPSSFNKEVQLSENKEVPETIDKEKMNSIINIDTGCNNSNKNENNNKYDTISRNNIGMPESKINNNTNILTIDVDSECEDLGHDELPNNSLMTNEDNNRYEDSVKIVGIQEAPPNSHSLDIYTKSLGQENTNENMKLTNSSLVFVGSDVGNVNMNQDQSQIIVIPFDYYKEPNDGRNALSASENNKDLELMSNGIVTQEKANIIFQGEVESNITPLPAATPILDNNCKAPAVDGNILTESDFLQNKQLFLNLEKELYKTEHPVQPQVSIPNEAISIQTVTTPLIVVSQPPPRPLQYRKILPKQKQNPEIHPVVVVQPLLEKNKEIRTRRVERVKPVEPIFRSKTREQLGRKAKKKSLLGQKVKAKREEKTEVSKEPLPEVNIAEVSEKNEKTEKPEVVVTSEKENENNKTNEEKENLDKGVIKKNETPVYLTRRNSKRLSLSTPRRRSHIRALEFETPPKANEDKKRSKTSPKAKVEPVKVERKSVRNTLFKSPIPEDSFKSPVVPKENKEATLDISEPPKTDSLEPLNEMSIPIATRSPNTKLSDAWENLTGVGCVIGPTEPSKASPVKKLWDADLRYFISGNNIESNFNEKKKVRKPEKVQKDNRRSTKKKAAPTKRIKPIPVTVSPSKISLTAKRNTYSINGNEEGSPIRSLLDDLKIVTPFKDMDVIRPTEETPLTKLLRENINTIDIDLSMINTPSFPPTPSILITPDLDDVSITGTNYYSPSKDSSKDKVLKITDFFEKTNKKESKEVTEPEKNNKRDSKEMHEKVIGDLVSKAKEIIGIGKETDEENSLKRPSGKILSMVKIQMLSQCDKKLMENIPINEEVSFSNSINNLTVIGNVIEESAAKTDLKVELEEKRKRALKKIKVVKENLTQTRSRVSKRGRKRMRSANSTKSDKSKSDISKEEFESRPQTPESNESIKQESKMYHSTPYAKHDLENVEKTNSDKKDSEDFLDDIRQLFPPFLNDPEKYPELNEKSRKKLHFVENFLKLDEIVKFLSDFCESDPPKLFLKPSLRRFFHVFYKWLKHPHKRELNASAQTNGVLKEYLSLFDKLNMGLNRKRFKRGSAGNSGRAQGSDFLGNSAESKDQSDDDDEKDCKKRERVKRKDEDTEDGVVSTLPLKKRKATVQQVDNKTAGSAEKSDTKNHTSENVSQTQNFLQDIDVDRFLSQIHGQETR